MARPKKTRESGLERVRALALAHEGAIEKLSHGEPTWFTGPKGRVFAMFDNHHHGAAHASVWIATPRDVQESLVAAEPERYFVPPYVGVNGWTGAVLDEDPDWDAITGLIDAAFRLTSAPRKR